MEDLTKAMKFLSYFQRERAKTFREISIVKPIKIYTEDVARKIKKLIKRLLPVYGYQLVVTEQYVMIRLFNKILFEKDTVKLTPQAKKALEKIAQVIKSLNGNYRVRVEGHTSKDEPTKPIKGVNDSWDLSILRATQVAKYLISKGVDPKKVFVVGYDATRPLYTWNNPILQARNRRVEIYLEVAVPKEEEEEKVLIKKKEKLPTKGGEERKASSEKR